MTNLQKGLQREIAAFVEAIQSDGGSMPEVSKAAFCKARKKIKPEAFKELGDVVLKGFYESNEVNLWHDHRVLAIDGSTVELLTVRRYKGNTAFLASVRMGRLYAWAGP